MWNGLNKKEEKFLNMHVVESLYWQTYTSNLWSVTEWGFRHRFLPKDFPILTENLFCEAAANSCFWTAIAWFPHLGIWCIYRNNVPKFSQKPIFFSNKATSYRATVWDILYKLSPTLCHFTSRWPMWLYLHFAS